MPTAAPHSWGCHLRTCLVPTPPSVLCGSPLFTYIYHQPPMLQDLPMALPQLDITTAGRWAFPFSSLSFLPAGTSGENILNLYCEIFIWAPLAGVCLVLLVALIVTIVLCQSKSHPDTLQRFLEPHTTEYSPFLQGNGLSAYCPHATIAYPGHRECRRTALKILFHIFPIYTFSFRNIYHILLPDNK